MPVAVPSPEPVRQPLDAEGSVRLEASACLTLRSGPAACDACRTVCPNGSLSLSETFHVSDACLGCGRCAASCPSGALTVRGFEAIEASPNGNIVAIECLKVPASIAGHHALRVPCTGGITPSRWLALAAASAPRRVVIVDRGWCRQCTANACNGKHHPASAALAPADAVLAAVGWPEAARPHVRHEPLPAALMPAAIPDARTERPSRRGLFRRIGSEARRAVGEPVAAMESSPRRLREREMSLPERDRFLYLARSLARAAGAAVPASPFVEIHVGEACANHQLCARLCPTGALGIEADAVTSGLSFDADACTTCGLCAKHCPEGAIRLLPATKAPAGRIKLTSFGERTCQRCQAAFSGPDSRRMCPQCTLSRDLGSALFGSGTLLAEPSMTTVPVSPSGGAHHE